MDAALDKVAAAVDKAEPAVEKAVRSALGDKAGDAVHAAAEHVKETLKDDVSFFFAKENTPRWLLAYEEEQNNPPLIPPSLPIHPF